MKRTIEILAPAGSWESMEAAVSAGADAIYMGGSRFGARAYADNLSQELLLKAIDYVHLHGRKIYLTVNTLLKNWELDELYDYLAPYYERGLDAVIVQDTGVMKVIRKCFPKLPVHVSTQATVTGTPGARFFERLGVERIVPARELSISEIRDIKENTGLEVECFVHGAMCYCYSGQCLLSSMIGGRSGNRGQCAQPCRLPYSVPGSKPEDLMSLKDMSMIQMIPELVDAGIDSFKIEGRMKQPEYVYTVVKLYRKYTDLYLKTGKAGYHVSEEDRRELEGAYRRRGYIDGYYKRRNGREMISFERPENSKEENSHKRDYKIKEKINGKLILSEGKHAKLCVKYKTYKKAYCVEATGEIVQTAQKAPLDVKRVEKQMKKTGNTAFVFDLLDIEIEGKVFLSMQALNELRRDCLQQLEETVLNRFRRDRNETQKYGEWKEQENTDADIAVTDAVKEIPDMEVSVQNAEQLAAALRTPEVCAVYVEGDIALNTDVIQILRSGRRGKGVKLYFSMPYIFRRDTAGDYEIIYEKIQELYDGIRVRNWGSYEWLRQHNYSKVIISDYNMYVFNRESKEFMKQAKITDYTVSPELNARELAQLGPGGILSVYGYQPVMITANCIWKTTKGCQKKTKMIYLTDRRKKKFAVKNHCKYCYNIIYNCAPLVLFDMAEEIKKLNISKIRLDFTTENAEKMCAVIRLCKKAFSGEKSFKMPALEYTRGHFKRGVK